jgi:predicted thioesterase
MGSGDVSVVATPVLISLVERAAVGALQGKLPGGQTTVGAAVQIQHEAPSPAGSRIRADVRIEGAQGKRLMFAFRVSDGSGEVARGRHLRAVVDQASFEQSAAARLTGR